MIFVTGGTGVLGNQLLFDLTHAQNAVRALYRSQKKVAQTKRFFQKQNPESFQAQFDRIEWVQGNILDVTSLDELLPGCTHVYHCAALVSFHREDYFQLMEVNREGTANVVNACLDHNIEKLCYVSSTAAIGGSAEQITTEETKWKNTPTTTGYSISKYSAEKEIWRGIEEGLNAVMVNPCVILGAGNWDDSSLTVFRTVSKGTRFYPPGANATVDARDVSYIMIQLMNSEIHSERFLCIGSNQSFKDLMTAIAHQLGAKTPSKPVKKWMVSLARRLLKLGSFFTSKRPAITKETVNALFDQRSYDSSKIRERLQFEFRELDETIRYSIEGRLDQS